MSKVREDLLNILTARSKPLLIRKELETLEYSTAQIEENLSMGIPDNENSAETKRWRTIFSNWDNAEGNWTEDSLPRSKERRDLIHRRLGIPETNLGKDLINKIPLNEPKVQIAVISKGSEHEDWLTGNRIPKDGYWESYKHHLIEKKKWDERSIVSLDTATTRILNHLIDPLSDKLVRAKGLVVGYVQSGKTANYSALIAKAVDAGYCLIVVLSGRTDILRNQTQVRLDFELSGWNSLDSDEQERYVIKSNLEHQNYKDKFVNYDGPHRFLRWTKTEKDFNPGSIALHDTGNPCIAVLKKIPNRLKRFAEILGKSEWRTKPVLLIDDESDDGSINTSKNDITTTAKLIADILKASDASQYVGYTATPYANVFIRPDRVEELFPSDFVICLDRPQHYMGALETFDIGDCEIDPEDIFRSSNEKSFIRVIEENDTEHNPFADLSKLSEAIDSFVLAGGIKKWREVNGHAKFKHHTMLINTDYLVKKHESIAIDVEDLLNRLYPSGNLDKASNIRLEKLWVNDFFPVCKARTISSNIPEDWTVLRPFVSDVIKRITQHKVLIVNCENTEDTPDFEDPSGCWTILVGGQKLSRGYTIEGLTTSYFSRRPGQLDTLVQMSRWYGFRKNYHDLVRLYIPETLPLRKSKKTSKSKKQKKYPLLDTFRFGAKVEEAFRSNLMQYSKDLRPDDIPPLVQWEFEDFPYDFKHVTPTAANKKRHARFETHYLGGIIKTVTRIGGAQSQNDNTLQLIKMLNSCVEGVKDINIHFENMSERILTGLTDSNHYLAFLKDVRYSDSSTVEKPRVIREQIEALSKMKRIGWRIMIFTPKESDRKFNIGGYLLPRWERNYIINEGVLKYEKPLNPPHRDIAAWFAKIGTGNKLTSKDADTLKLQNENVGVLYVVPFSKKEDDKFYFLWCAVYPGTGRAGAYRVIQSNSKNNN